MPNRGVGRAVAAGGRPGALAAPSGYRSSMKVLMATEIVRALVASIDCR